MESDKIEKAVVRIEEKDENLTITLKIADRVRILNRPKSEAVGRALQRVRLSFVSQKKKKRKGDRQDVEENGLDEAPVALYGADSNQTLLDEALTNEEAWRMARLLVAGNARYEIVTNPPTVTKLVLNETPIVDHPIYPLCQLQFADEDACLWEWFKKKSRGGEWKGLNASSRVYVPTTEDTGCFLGLQCTPVFKGENGAALPVEGPRTGDPCFTEIGPVLPKRQGSAGTGRHELTSSPLPSPSFRVVSYNLLADTYVTRPNYHKDQLCSPKDYHIDVRKQLILKEVLAYNADIICFQECDEAVFQSYYQHHMHLNGFECFFAQKSGTTREGEATFIRKSRFKVLEHRREHMNQLLDGDLPHYLRPFESMIATGRNMRDGLKNLVTIGQMSLLEGKNGEGNICAINTHLISKAHGEHIRVLHVVAMINKARELIASHGIDAQILLIGDLNATPDCKTGQHDASITLLNDGHVPADHWEWENCKNFSWKVSEDKDNETDQRLYESASIEDQDPIEGIDISIPVSMKSAMDLSTPYSNYASGFQGLLDYVWYETRQIEAVRSIPIPTPEMLGGPCPSAVYPSDHLAVVVDLAFLAGDSQDSTTAVGQVKKAVSENISLGTEALKAGKIIAVPTDTLYGLAADASNKEAIDALYAIKGRASEVPLAICVGKPDDVAAVCEAEHLPNGLLHALLPGPVTVVLRRRQTASLSSGLNPGRETLGVRVPNSEFICRLCEEFGGPVALTSANLSGEPSSIHVSDFKNLWSSCSIVFDAGDISDSKLGSTVVDLSESETFMLLRNGDGADVVHRTMRRYCLTERRQETSLN